MVNFSWPDDPIVHLADVEDGNPNHTITWFDKFILVKNLEENQELYDNLQFNMKFESSQQVVDSTLFRMKVEEINRNGVSVRVILNAERTAYRGNPHIENIIAPLTSGYFKFRITVSYQISGSIGDDLWEDDMVKEFVLSQKRGKKIIDCFIATQVYGEEHPKTERLRKFRNEKLLTSSLGILSNINSSTVFSLHVL